MKKLKSSQSSPAPRANAFLCVHKNQGFLLGSLFFSNFLIFLVFLAGGASRTAEFTDIWSFSLENGETRWTSLAQSLKKPLPARVGTAFCQVNHEVFLHGGQNFSENLHFEDFYTINLGNFLCFIQIY